jgi:hypothetical protein
VTDETSTPWRERQSRVAAIAARQWGTVTTSQLRACGVSSAVVRRWVQRGLLHGVHRGVYVFGAPIPAPESKWAAALLAAGTGAVLSHTSAAGCHGLLPVREVTEVTTPKQRRGDDLIRVHHRAGVEVTHRRGLPVTTVGQTLLDLAAIGWPIDRLTHEAAASSLVALDDLKTFALDKRRALGATRLKKALGLPHTRSRWERDFFSWLTSLEDIPPAIPNDPIGPLTVDLHWPEHDLVVELDTEQTHGTAWARVRDEERDRWLHGRGKNVLRVRQESFDRDVTHRQLRVHLGVDPSRAASFTVVR